MHGDGVACMDAGREEMLELKALISSDFRLPSVKPLHHFNQACSKPHTSSLRAVHKV
jgi:hypothetical protein